MHYNFIYQVALAKKKQGKFWSFQSSYRLPPYHTMGVARIFDRGGPKPQITCNDVIKNLRKRNFLWDVDIAEWKISSRGLCLALNQDFTKGRGLKPKF